VGAESTGVPVPGETALITAGVLAHHGEFEIQLVIVVAAAGAIVATTSAT
jgi:membrane protein DedA with SNARE-associated domain